MGFGLPGLRDGKACRASHAETQQAQNSWWRKKAFARKDSKRLRLSEPDEAPPCTPAHSTAHGADTAQHNTAAPEPQEAVNMAGAAAGAAAPPWQEAVDVAGAAAGGAAEAGEAADAAPAPVPAASPMQLPHTQPSAQPAPAPAAPATAAAAPPAMTTVPGMAEQASASAPTGLQRPPSFSLPRLPGSTDSPLASSSPRQPGKKTSSSSATNSTKTTPRSPSARSSVVQGKNGGGSGSAPAWHALLRQKHPIRRGSDAVHADAVPAGASQDQLSSLSRTDAALPARSAAGRGVPEAAPAAAPAASVPAAGPAAPVPAAMPAASVPAPLQRLSSRCELLPALHGGAAAAQQVPSEDGRAGAAPLAHRLLPPPAAPLLQGCDAGTATPADHHHRATAVAAGPASWPARLASHDSLTGPSRASSRLSLELGVAPRAPSLHQFSFLAASAQQPPQSAAGRGVGVGGALPRLGGTDGSEAGAARSALPHHAATSHMLPTGVAQPGWRARLSTASSACSSRQGQVQGLHAPREGLEPCHGGAAAQQDHHHHHQHHHHQHHHHQRQQHEHGHERHQQQPDALSPELTGVQAELAAAHQLAAQQAQQVEREARELDQLHRRLAALEGRLAEAHARQGRTSTHLAHAQRQLAAQQAAGAARLEHTQRQLAGASQAASQGLRQQLQQLEGAQAEAGEAERQLRQAEALADEWRRRHNRMLCEHRPAQRAGGGGATWWEARAPFFQNIEHALAELEYRSPRRANGNGSPAA